MSEHTPGPWTFDWSVSMHDRPDLPCVIDADRLIVAQCWDDGHSERECEANARLIAAAPDLYEALSEIVSAEREAIREWEATGGPPWNDTHPAYQRYSKAIAALSKVSQQTDRPQSQGQQNEGAES